MIQSFAKYTCVIAALILTTTNASHATFSLFKNKIHDSKITSILEHKATKIINIKKDVISLLPEYCPPTTPPVPHTPPHVPPVPHTPTPHTPSTSVSEPFALLATLGAMSAFLYRRRHKAQ